MPICINCKKIISNKAWKKKLSKCRDCYDISNNNIISKNIKCIYCNKYISEKLYNIKKSCYKCSIMNNSKNYKKYYDRKNTKLRRELIDKKNMDIFF